MLIKKGTCMNNCVMLKVVGEYDHRKICAEYFKLQKLKKALGVDEKEEFNNNMLLDFAIKHNASEIYLLEYLINKIIKAPPEILAQNFLLNGYYKRPEDYKKIFDETKRLYSNDPVFKKYAVSVNKGLDLYFGKNRQYVNCLIYEIAHTYITDVVELQPKNIFLNFHLIQSWLISKKNFDFRQLKPIEEQIIIYIANGFSIKDIINEKMPDGNKSDEYIKTVIEEILPLKFGVKTIHQVMALVYMKNSHISDVLEMENRIEELREIIQREGI